MEVDSFVFYRSFYESIEELSDEDRLAIYDAICAYALNHEENEIEKPIARGMFKLIKPQLNANYKKRINGSKGGRPASAKSSEELEDTAKMQGKTNLDKTEIKPNANLDVTEIKPNANLDVTEIKPNANLDVTENKPNVNVNVNGNVNVNANENVNGNVKHKNGLYKHVLLTQMQYDSLLEDFGKEKLDYYIKQLDEYIQMTGKKYKDHNLVIRNWARKDSGKKSQDDSLAEEYRRIKASYETPF